MFTCSKTHWANSKNQEEILRFSNPPLSYMFIWIPLFTAFFFEPRKLWKCENQNNWFNDLVWRKWKNRKKIKCLPTTDFACCVYFDVGTFNGFYRHFCRNQSELGFIRTKKTAPSLFRFCLWCFNFTMWRAFDFIHKIARKMQKRGFQLA